MSKMFKGVIAFAAGTALALGGALAAHATTEYPPEGGTWEYGVLEYSSTPFVHSDYLHNSAKHRSSVKVSAGTIYRSSDKAAGYWSTIEKATGYSGNHAYYYKY